MMLLIGGTAGVSAHVLFPGLPEGLAFTAMFAALPAALVAAPFSLLLVAALTTQIGTLQITPVAVLETMKSAGTIDELGDDRLFDTVRDAVDATTKERGTTYASSSVPPETGDRPALGERST